MDSSDGLTPNEFVLLRETKTEQEWNAVCDQIKGARGGLYPDDWYILVVMSGEMKRISDGWKRHT